MKLSLISPEDVKVAEIGARSFSGMSEHSSTSKKGLSIGIFE
jgi:hypothetical protein